MGKYDIIIPHTNMCKRMREYANSNKSTHSKREIKINKSGKLCKCLRIFLLCCLMAYQTGQCDAHFTRFYPIQNIFGFLNRLKLNVKILLFFPSSSVGFSIASAQSNWSTHKM